MRILTRAPTNVEGEVQHGQQLVVGGRNAADVGCVQCQSVGTVPDGKPVPGGLGWLLGKDASVTVCEVGCRFG